MRSAVDGAPDWCTTSAVVTACPRISAGLPGSISTISNGKRHLLDSARGKNTLERRVEPRARAGRTGDGERALAPRQELRVEQQERQRAEMVAVQMREDDAVDVAVVEPVRLERHQRRTPRNRPASVAFAVSSQKQVLKRPPEPKASPQPTMVSRMLRHPRSAAPTPRRASGAHWRSASGTASLAGFMKSMAIRPVMSATV